MLGALLGSLVPLSEHPEFPRTSYWQTAKPRDALSVPELKRLQTHARDFPDSSYGPEGKPCRMSSLGTPLEIAVPVESAGGRGFVWFQYRATMESR